MFISGFFTGRVVDDDVSCTLFLRGDKGGPEFCFRKARWAIGFPPGFSLFVVSVVIVVAVVAVDVFVSSVGFVRGFFFQN